MGDDTVSFVVSLNLKRRQIALAGRLGVPEALGYPSLRQWVKERLGGCVNMELGDRWVATKNLEHDGYTVKETADILGVSDQTVCNDRAATKNFETDEEILAAAKAIRADRADKKRAERTTLLNELSRRNAPMELGVPNAETFEAAGRLR